MNKLEKKNSEHGWSNGFINSGNIMGEIELSARVVMRVLRWLGYKQKIFILNAIHTADEIQ